MKERVGIALAGLFFAAAIFCFGAAVGTLAGPPKLPACTTEDSTNCLWDARVHGNGQGHSFIDWEGHTYYLGK